MCVYHLFKSFFIIQNMMMAMECVSNNETEKFSGQQPVKHCGEVWSLAGDDWGGTRDG